MRLVAADPGLRDALRDAARARSGVLARQRPQWDEGLQLAIAASAEGVACDDEPHDLRAVTR